MYILTEPTPESNSVLENFSARQSLLYQVFCLPSPNCCVTLPQMSRSQGLFCKDKFLRRTITPGEERLKEIFRNPSPQLMT